MNIVDSTNQINQDILNLNSFSEISPSQIIILSENLKRELYETEKITDLVSLKSLMGIHNFSGPIIPLNGRFSLPQPFPFLTKDNRQKILQELIIRYTTTQIYKERIEQIFTADHFFPDALKSIITLHYDDLLSFVILRALFEENILIRPPLSSEKEILWKDFLFINPERDFEEYREWMEYNEFEDLIKKNFFKCVTSEGSYLRFKESRNLASRDKIHEHVLVAGSVGNDAKIGGMINFIINIPANDEKTCYINSLKVLEKRKGLGTLLLSCAILTAIKEGCKKVILESSREGIPLYVLFGFVPKVKQSLLDGWWDKMSTPQKMKVCKKLYRYASFRLDITQQNYNMIMERINHIFNPLSSNYCDYKNAEIPKEAKKLFSMNLDESMSNCSEASSDEDSEGSEVSSESDADPDAMDLDS